MGLNPTLKPDMLVDHLNDFTAMHLDWILRIDRNAQQRILKKMLQRQPGKSLTSIREVHQLFWNLEKHIAYCISLLNAVPNAVKEAERLIDTAGVETLNLSSWHMVLALPCFKQEDETLRMILFELSQAYLFEDPDPLLAIDCMLDLEAEISNLKSVRQLEQEPHRIAIKSVRHAQDTSEDEHHEGLLRLLFEKPTPLRFYILEGFIGMLGRQGLEGTVKLC